MRLAFDGVDQKDREGVRNKNYLQVSLSLNIYVSLVSADNNIDWIQSVAHMPYSTAGSPIIERNQVSVVLLYAIAYCV